MCSDGTSDQVRQRESRSRRSCSQCQLVAVEHAVAQVDRQELRGQLSLLLQHLDLFADVAVDHAQDRRDAQPATERQASASEPTSLKTRRASGRTLARSRGQPCVEPVGSRSRKQRV